VTDDQSLLGAVARTPMGSVGPRPLTTFTWWDRF
jgi:hypothetical protein